MQRWQAIRLHWQTHNKSYDRRYADSYELLDGLYNLPK